jgi:hypothetical protein
VASHEQPDVERQRLAGSLERDAAALDARLERDVVVEGALGLAERTIPGEARGAEVKLGEDRRPRVVAL